MHLCTPPDIPYKSNSEPIQKKSKSILRRNMMNRFHFCARRQVIIYTHPTSRKETICRGLKPTLAAAFYPHYRYRLACKGPLLPGCSQEVKKVHKGIKGGERVDQAVQELVFFSQANIPLEQLFDTSLSITSEPLRERLKRFKRQCPPAVKDHFIPHLIQRGWKPILSQIPVGLEELRIGTQVDLIVESTHKEPILLEIKNGFERYYMRHTPFGMNAPFIGTDDSPYHQHQLQLSFTRLALSRYWKITPGEIPALVIQITPQGVKEWPLEWKYYENEPLMIEAREKLKENKYENQQTRRKECQKQLRKMKAFIKTLKE